MANSINHITEVIVDNQYARAVCGDILIGHPKHAFPKEGYLDWKPIVNCQKCLKTAIDRRTKK